MQPLPQMKLQQGVQQMSQQPNYPIQGQNIVQQSQQPQAPKIAPTKKLEIPTINDPNFENVETALKIVERFKSGAITNQITVKRNYKQNLPANIDSDAVKLDAPFLDEQPFLLEDEVFQGRSKDWESIWKPDTLDRMHIDTYVFQQRAGNESKQSVSKFRQHASTCETSDVWIARDISLMHTAQCLNSKKNKHCLGCSNFWRTAQSIEEEFKAWGPNDMLRFEPSHSETFLGTLMMNSSFIAPTTEMLSTDLINTLVTNRKTINAIIFLTFLSTQKNLLVLC